MNFKDTGCIYQGAWVKGKREGQGSMLYHGPGGGCYEGCFVNNSITGGGTFAFKNGDRYEGAFERGQMSGAGTYTFSNGDVFKGRFEDNLKEGEGVLSYACGDEYRGRFLHDLKHGPGHFTYADNRSYRGIWEEGKFKAYNQGKGAAAPAAIEAAVVQGPGMASDQS